MRFYSHLGNRNAIEYSIGLALEFTNRIIAATHDHMIIIWLYEVYITFGVFRCVFASLYEGLSVGPLVRWFVGPLVCWYACSWSVGQPSGRPSVRPSVRPSCLALSGPTEENHCFSKVIFFYQFVFSQLWIRQITAWFLVYSLPKPSSWACIQTCSEEYQTLQLLSLSQS